MMQSLQRLKLNRAYTRNWTLIRGEGTSLLSSIFAISRRLPIFQIPYVWRNHYTKKRDTTTVCLFLSVQLSTKKTLCYCLKNNVFQKYGTSYWIIISTYSFATYF